MKWLVRFLGKVLLLVLAAYVVFFSLVGTAFLIAPILVLALVVTGHGPERTDVGIGAVIGSILLFPLALLAFATLSLPGFAFVVTTLRSVWRDESGAALKDVRRAMTSGDPD